jgi:hypothetical protein
MNDLKKVIRRDLQYADQRFLDCLGQAAQSLLVV